MRQDKAFFLEILIFILNSSNKGAIQTQVQLTYWRWI